ncbi:iron-sulfur cluster assembly accessory protein [Mariprofundus sp. EBB-1]|uniref:HesB/IscA family protein n=1 Tax=Mariprofundus sp. EBB-1 TaxID=2650971 RepID=UPI000EF29381|nr:iron-sulfur cluster assembly accessory protein [Mariprofundus sp. EBB-1]RLL50085.1 iron-sulfur cluster assembly accessory protein [Mariprofundus sp. EBB-1]
MDRQIDIELTEAAIARVHKLVSDAGKAGLSLAVRPAGCSGLEYVMDLADAAKESDLVQSYDGFDLYVDAESYASALTGLKLDFQQDALSSAFVYHNPNQEGACGCGESFSVK